MRSYHRVIKNFFKQIITKLKTLVFKTEKFENVISLY